MGVLKRYNGVGWESVGVPLDVAMSPQTLGYNEWIAGSPQAIGTGPVDLVSVTVTVPEGRRLKVSGFACTGLGTASYNEVRITMDGVQINRSHFGAQAAGQIATHTPSFVVTPTAGTHVFKLQSNNAVAGTIYNDIGNETMLLVEDITGSTLPYQPSSVPVGLLAQARLTADSAAGLTPGYDPGFTANFTVPAGRSVEVDVGSFISLSTAGGVGRLFVEMDGVGIQQAEAKASANGEIVHIDTKVVVSPSAGTHTIKVRWDVVVGGTFQILASTAYPAYIYVKDVTPTPAPANTAPSSTLAYAEATTSQGSITTETDLTGLSATISVPAGRRIRITAHAYPNSTVADDTAKLWIKEGSTYLQSGERTLRKTTNADSVDASVILSPSAGTHTYKLSMLRQNGSGTITNNASTDSPSYILIEDITGGTLPQFSGAGLPSSTLGYAQITANQAGITSEVDVTGLSVTVTVPANRRIKITAYSGSVGSTVANDVARLSIKEGSTLMQLAQDTCRGSFDPSILAEWIGTPSAGTHTYKVTAARLTGTGTITVGADAQYPAFILVEDITGVGIPGHTHGELDDTGWIALDPYLVNGWVSYDNTYGPPKFRRKAGVVYVTGLVRSGTNGSVIATLPVGFRPTSQPKLLFPSACGEPGQLGRIDVESNGNIIHAMGVNGYFTLSTIIFPV